MEWWQDFFHGSALTLWERAVTPEWTRGEVEGALKLLDPKPGAELLDVPCGFGRIALELARRGYRVAGIDLTAEWIEAARANAGALPVEFVQGDMRRIPWRARFDAAFSLGNSFGYFEDEAAHGAFVAAVAAALKPGGRFLLEAASLESVLIALQPTRQASLGDLEVNWATRYLPREGRLVSTYTFVRGGAREVRTASYRMFTVRQIVELLEANGFRDVETFAGLDGAPFEFGAQRLYLRGRKA